MVNSVRQQERAYRMKQPLPTKKNQKKIFKKNYEIFQLNWDNSPKKLEVFYFQSENDIYILELSRQNNKNFNLYLLDLKTHEISKLIIWNSLSETSFNFVKIWCSYGILALYDRQKKKLLIGHESDEPFRVFKFDDPIEEVHFDETGQKNVAVITKGDKVSNFNFSYYFLTD
ncbi:hypothetical protein RF11_05225 [Thelohanellus kitauei]|uniref:Uncharacterized protein n=1 Tax=Thelohanellus kitauei TaxID=669202 RepID=A0A0C2N098_THEKT|nr:hypothetical protein RF11_05225 [Thelohanellus kitauei]